MALGDGIRRNIAHVDPSERALLRDALIELNARDFPGNRTDPIPGGVSWWFKQDEIHQATHVHGGPEFLPWHREIVNRLEAMLRQINPQLSLHYWDWTQDPRNIPNANLGGGTTGNLNLFTNDFMGYGGAASNSIGQPWLGAGYYVPGASPHRDNSGNPADPPRNVTRFVAGSPRTAAQDNDVLNGADYQQMRSRLESGHNAMHGFVNMGGAHISFRDPFVFLLHSNVDRLFAMWQAAAGHPERLDPNGVYASGGVTPPAMDENIEPWSGVPATTRPWAPPENEQVAKNYKHHTVVALPRYDTVTLLLRKGDSANQAGFVSEIAAIKHGTQQVVTAVRTQENTLKLISWRVNNDGSVTRTGDSAALAGEASEIDIARGDRYVTACRTAANNLKLISWDVNNAGAITRAGDSGNQAGEASEIKIVVLSSTLLVTACRTAAGALKLISWRLNNDGSLTRLNDSANLAGAVGEVSLLVLQSGNGGGVVTSVRDGNGKLKLIVWNVTAAGAITRLGDSAAQAGEATMIRSAKDSAGHVITAVRTAEGTLKLISWSVSANGNTVTRLADSGGQAGQIGDNALMSRPGGLMISAVRTASGTLKLISWAVAATGAITRSNDSANQAGTASLITICRESLSGGAPIVTAVRTASNTLKLITWSA